MTAATLTLADFLLARIAEDEAALRSDANDLLRGQIVVDQVPAEVVRKLNREIGPSSPWRLLAECKAKRLRIGHAVALLDAGRGWGDYVEMSLALEALPFADHPDYRESWRP